MEGANDLAPTMSLPAVAAGLGRMIDNARSRGLKVYLATIPPENASSPCMPQCRGGNAGLVPPFNDQVRALAASKGIPLVDVFQAFNGDVITLIGPDGLHPSEAGYHLIADTFFSAIKQTLEVSPPTPTDDVEISLFQDADRRPAGKAPITRRSSDSAKMHAAHTTARGTRLACPRNPIPCPDQRGSRFVVAAKIQVDAARRHRLRVERRDRHRGTRPTGNRPRDVSIFAGGSGIVDTATSVTARP